MSDSQNPFARRQTDSPTTPGSIYYSVGVIVVAILIALLFVMLWLNAKRELVRQTAPLKEELQASREELARLQKGVQTNNDFITDLRNQISDLQKEKELAGQMAKNLENEMRASLESKDITISNLQGRLTVTIVDRVMFDSGEAVLKPDGAAVMVKIAALLAEHPKLKIHVIGHTDNVPLRSGARFASNWELSTARALAAVHYLTERAGVDPRRVGALGYGEFHPIADNATAEGRAKNRRIAISILPEEFVSSDVPPAVNEPASGGKLPP